MAKVAPHFQTRSQQPRDWGNYASLLVLPNAAGWLGGSSASFALEEGDTAFVVGLGPAYCVSAGTPGSLNALWRVVGTQRVLVPVAASTIAAAGTTPVAYGAVYLDSPRITLTGLTIQATSRALVGAIGGGIATVQVRRQSTGALVAGFAWSTAAALNNQVLAGAVTIFVADWYVFEIVSDTIGAFAVVQSVELFLQD